MPHQSRIGDTAVGVISVDSGYLSRRFFHSLSLHLYISTSRHDQGHANDDTGDLDDDDDDDDNCLTV